MNGTLSSGALTVTAVSNVAILAGMSPANGQQGQTVSLALTALLSLAAAGAWGAPAKEPALWPDPPEPRMPVDAGLLFARLIILTGLALTLSVEFFYLRDSFGVRMNTVFKFYYQGWAMLGLASAYGLWWLSYPAKEILGGIPRFVLLPISALLILAGMVYPILSGLNRMAVLYDSMALAISIFELSGDDLEILLYVMTP